MSTLVLPLKILIADDQTLFRAGLARLLSGDTRLEVVGQAKDGEDAVVQALQRQPDVVLMDLLMPTVTGFEATRRLSAEAPGMRVLAMTSLSDAESTGEALRSGARGCINKDATPDEMVARIFGLYTETPATQAAEAKLSRRELQLLRLVAEGLSNKQVALRLNLSQKTVRNHLSRVFGKLKVSNRTEAVMDAMRRGLFQA